MNYILCLGVVLSFLRFPFSFRLLGLPDLIDCDGIYNVVKRTAQLFMFQAALKRTKYFNIDRFKIFANDVLLKNLYSLYLYSGS